MTRFKYDEIDDEITGNLVEVSSYSLIKNESVFSSMYYKTNHVKN